ncbi:hypothetical protein, partial [Luteimonas panaciterrae]|uniref:hypothetical protein n=1 Tax=Luteimonas panaciterrae TaxID=363885 RepID=UPI001CFA195E
MLFGWNLKAKAFRPLSQLCSSSQRKLGSIWLLPLLLLLKDQKRFAPEGASSFLLVSPTARAGARANGEAGSEGVSAMDGANQRNE